MSSRPRIASALCAAAFPLLFLALPAIAQAATPGSLIKLTDDRNAATDADSAVYYYGADGKRYVFPNDKIYFSWYADFSTVKEVDAATLADIPLGGNVTYRPGTRLVKLETDPKVYAVGPQGSLRPLASESAAIALYGPAWAKRVDDLSDAFFTSYHLGASLDGAALPDGSVVRRASDGAVFYVDGASLRRIASASIQADLRIRESFILATTSDLSAYVNGPNLSFAEPALSDVAQLEASDASSAGGGDGTIGSGPPSGPVGAAFTWRGENGFAVTGHRVLLGTLKAETRNDAYDLKALTVRFIGQLDAIARVELDAGGQTVGMPYPGNVADFENLPFRLARNAATTVSVFAVMKPAVNGYHDEHIQADISSSQRFLMASVANGATFDQVSLQEDPRFPLVSTPSDLYVRFTELSFAKSSDTPGGGVGRASAAPVLRFTARADASGPARIKHLTFKLEPGDVASSGAPDALENWATMDGDALDDVDVVNLWRSDVSSGSAVGEGDEAVGVDLHFSIVSAGVKDATPEGRDSAVNDYGLIEYDFREGHELVIPAGQTIAFTLDLAMDRFTPGSWKLKVSLLGGFDVQWTDTTVGAYTPITGVVVPGLPLETSGLTVP